MDANRLRDIVINYGTACIVCDRAEAAYNASTADTFRAAAAAMDAARNQRFDAMRAVESALASLTKDR